MQIQGQMTTQTRHLTKYTLYQCNRSGCDLSLVTCWQSLPSWPLSRMVVTSCPSMIRQAARQWSALEVIYAEMKMCSKCWLGRWLCKNLHVLTGESAMIPTGTLKWEWSRMYPKSSLWERTSLTSIFLVTWEYSTPRGIRVRANLLCKVGVDVPGSHTVHSDTILCPLTCQIFSNLIHRT